MRDASRSSPVFRVVAAAALAVAAVTQLTGCALFAMAAQPFEGKVKPIYKLPDRTTLVVVDDPTGLLSDPGTAGVIAANVKLELENNKAFEKGSVIDPAKLALHMAELGPAGAKVPLVRLARDMGAEQVIGVEVGGVDFNQDPGAYRPSMVVRVKLIDAVSGKRVFPPLDSGEAADVATATRGYPVQSQLFYKAVADDAELETARGMRLLAKRAGRDVARVFTSYQARRPGEPFED
ncbi:MAG: hypothetical protein K8S99_09300 [Planctomycetes bacterium]|nr:hypothetical protein [Planctomycetota bacterium]